MPIKEGKHTDEKLDKDFKNSGLRLLQLKANRHVDDIPLTDEYWLALQYHNKAFGVNK